MTVAFAVYGAEAALSKDAPWVRTCEEMRIKDQWKDLHVSTKDECHLQMKSIIYTFLTFALVLLTLVEIHYCLVIYTHWKNYAKDKEVAAKEVRPFSDEQSITTL